MILRNDIPKTCRYTRMILYSLQHFKALQLHIRTGEMRREKIYPAEHLGGKKYPAHQGCQKKNLLTRNHPPPPPSRVKWSAPYCHCGSLHSVLFVFIFQVPKLTCVR